MRTDHHRLEMTEVLDLLFERGMIRAEDREALRFERPRSGGDSHPFSVIGDRRVSRADRPQQVLTAEALAEWMAHEVGLPFVRIDPLPGFARARQIAAGVTTIDEVLLNTPPAAESVY